MNPEKQYHTGLFLFVILLVTLTTLLAGCRQPTATFSTDPTRAPATATERPSPPTAAPTEESTIPPEPPAATADELQPELHGFYWGYVDTSGTWIIEPQFDSAQYFSEGLAAVYKDGLSGYIDASGQSVITPQFAVANAFSEGLAAVAVDMKWGYINPTGEFVIEPRFDYAENFTEGFGHVMEDTLHGYIDPSGQWVIEPQFAAAYSFSEGLALVQRSEQEWAYIDPSGQVAIQMPMEYGNNFSEGLAAVIVNGKWGFIDKTGAMVIEPQYDSVQNFSEGLAVIYLNGLSGYINQSGAMVIEAQYLSAQDFSEGLAAVQSAGDPQAEPGSDRWGYIDATGNFVIPPQFMWADAFSDGLASVNLEESRRAYIDTQGQIVFEIAPLIIGETIAITPEQISFDYEGLVNAGMLTNVYGEVMPATPLMQGPGIGGHPAHLKFTLGEPSETEWVNLREAQLRIYPVDSYQEILDEAGYHQALITNLQGLLAERPAAPPDGIPILPPVPAAQMFSTQVKYLDFQGGSGVRFITQYSQAVVSINNMEIFYTFQGLTDDGAYYVTLFHPVSTSILPDTYEDSAMAEDYEAFAQNFEAYLQQTTQELNALGSAEFTPDLALLDAMLQSLSIASGE